MEIPKDIAEFLDSIAEQENSKINTWWLSPGVVDKAKQLCIEHGIWEEKITTDLPTSAPAPVLNLRAKALVEWFEAYWRRGPEGFSKSAIVQCLLGALPLEEQKTNYGLLLESLRLQNEWRAFQQHLLNSSVITGNFSPLPTNFVATRKEIQDFLEERLQRAKDATFAIAFQAVDDNRKALLEDSK